MLRFSNPSFRMAQSLAFPTLVQFNSKRYYRAALLLMVLMLLIAVYSWSGLVFSQPGFYGLLAIIALWWIAVAIDAIRYDDTKRSHPPLSSIWLALYGCGILALFLLILAYKQILLGFEVFRIPSHSMVPTFSPGQFVLVDTRPSFIERIKLGDIIVFKQKDRYFIKRWVGRGGTSIETKGRQLTSGEYSRTYDAAFVDRIWQVPVGRYFMMGDNQKFSSDSRRFGGVETSQLVGMYRFTFN